MSFIGSIIDSLRHTVGFHDDEQESHVSKTLNDAQKLKQTWDAPTRDLGKSQQWQYRAQNERDQNTRRRESGYAVVAYGRNGQPLGKSWETMSDYVAGINEEEAALFEEYKAAKAAAAAAAAAKE
eukprot:INCI4380.1.p1 GENE.INCI4380.1~~INCI4380.1.p1  ORF type:complete len:125 (+),score=34.65 INCI4380.1:120-494(+)